MHALLYVQVLRSLDMLRRAHSFVHHHQDIITLLHSILVIAMVVVIEVCQLHTVRNIAGECNLEVFDNLLTNWAAQKIIMITGNTSLPAEFVCMQVSFSRQTCTSYCMVFGTHNSLNRLGLCVLYTCNI